MAGKSGCEGESTWYSLVIVKLICYMYPDFVVGKNCFPGGFLCASSAEKGGND